MPFKYRREKSKLTYHWRQDCPRWPLEKYVEESFDHTFQAQLLCHRCRRLGQLKDK